MFNLSEIYRYTARIIANSALAKKETEIKGAMLLEYLTFYFKENRTMEQAMDFEWFLDCVAVKVFKVEIMDLEYSNEKLLELQGNDTLREMLRRMLR